MPSKTNAQVAAAIFKNPPVEVSASNFHACPGREVPSIGEPALGLTCEVGVLSYNTVIAAVILNANTGKRELWTTTRRYSSTTDRHMRLVLQAYRAAVATGEDIAHFSFNMEWSRSRTWTRQLSPLDSVYTQAMDNLKRVVARGVHTATRRAAFNRALDAVRHGLDTVTRDVPEAALLAATPDGHVAYLQWARDMEAMLLAWVDLSDADLRAAAAGYLALVEGEQS